MSRPVTIYKSKKVAELYVFVDTGYDIEQLPTELRSRLGVLSVALELEMKPSTTFQRTSADEVTRNLDSQGFHVQLPPSTYTSDS
ncbi:MAG: YcgL domain-containing protein [Pseudomonadaceae bacterium]|nr:YcgL domain-containing protein [Pseudomonadaceae bacterium]